MCQFAFVIWHILGRLSETQTEQEDRIRGLVPGTRLLSLCLAEGLWFHFLKEYHSRCPSQAKRGGGFRVASHPGQRSESALPRPTCPEISRRPGPKIDVMVRFIISPYCFVYTSISTYFELRGRSPRANQRHLPCFSLERKNDMDTSCSPRKGDVIRGRWLVELMSSKSCNARIDNLHWRSWVLSFPKPTLFKAKGCQRPSAAASYTKAIASINQNLMDAAAQADHNADWRMVTFGHMRCAMQLQYSSRAKGMQTSKEETLWLPWLVATELAIWCSVHAQDAL